MATDVQLESPLSATSEGWATVVSIDRHYSPAELAELWDLSNCLRKIFENELGVLVIGHSQPKRGKRNHTTLRIPQTVLNRVHRRLSKVRLTDNAWAWATEHYGVVKSTSIQ
jgi:hypothetical protein